MSGTSVLGVDPTTLCLYDHSSMVPQDSKRVNGWYQVLQSQPRSEIVSLLSHPIGLNAGSSQIQGFGLDPMYMGKIVDSHLWK